jgi:hypothetical protein
MNENIHVETYMPPPENSPTAEPKPENSPTAAAELKAPPAAAKPGFKRHDPNNIPNRSANARRNRTKA